MGTKQCKKCKEILSVEKFDWRKATNKYRNECTLCHRLVKYKWAENNPEKAKENRQNYYKNNPEKVKNCVKRWRLNNPEKRKVYANKRRALEQGSYVCPIETAKIFGQYNWVCGICGKRINKNLKYPNLNRVSLDHIIPLSKQGSHTEANIQLAHLRCNIVKGNKINNIQLKLSEVVCARLK